VKAKRLSPGGTIGIICTSHVADVKKYSRIVETLNRLGYKVKLGANIYKDTYGFAASAEERADDINTLIEDDDVQMILFGGGESAAEILPFIDYNKIKKHLKLFSSYSETVSNCCWFFG
jgi:muramoyltetrapeptide carboxypeptidase